jgi:hypothetical protein
LESAGHVLRDAEAEYRALEEQFKAAVESAL